MAHRIEGVDEKLLNSAKAEFLAKGYQNASLRNIADKADTSTSSIYTRFNDKEGFFKAVIQSDLTEFKKLLEDILTRFSNQVVKNNQAIYDKYEVQVAPLFSEYIYEHCDTFKILISGSSIGIYRDFVNELIEIDMKYLKKLLSSINGSYDDRLFGFFEVLSRSFFTTIIETIVYETNKDEILFYSERLGRFYDKGWKNILKEIMK